MEFQSEELTKTHPKGLYVLFFTEMWERFSYYGMRALLILYLVKYLHVDDSRAGTIYGLYTMMVYLTPLAGGYLADRLLGYRFSVFLGGTLMMLGHISLALDSLHTFYSGLALLILGNGFFKPNISTIVGKLYFDRPHLKDSAFTIFYMGINLGAMLGPIVCGYAAEFSWHWGFGSAGIGMFIGIVTFGLGSRKLPKSAFSRDSRDNVPLVSSDENNNGKVTEKFGKDRLLAIGFFTFFSIFFWVAFEQEGSSINLYADRHMDRTVFGYTIPASVLQSLNPILILILAPVFASFWEILRKAGKEPHTITKFAMGLFLLGLGFSMLVLGSWSAGEKASLSWFFLAFLFQTMGELCLSPVGLSLMTKLAPASIASFIMGFWFLSNAIAHGIAGYVSGFLSTMEEPGLFFGCFVVSSFLTGVFLLLIRKPMARKMHGID